MIQVSCFIIRRLFKKYSTTLVVHSLTPAPWLAQMQIVSVSTSVSTCGFSCALMFVESIALSSQWFKFHVWVACLCFSLMLVHWLFHRSFYMDRRIRTSGERYV